MQWSLDPDLKRSRAAVELLRKATGQSPDAERAWLALSRAQIEAGMPREAAACLRQALARLPQSAALHAALARVLRDGDAFEEALAEVARALSLAPRDKQALVLQFELFVLARKREDAARMAGDVAALAPDNPRLLEVSERLRGPEDLLALCDRRLSQHPGHTDAHHFKALALARLGRNAEACAVMALDRLVQMGELAAPPGFSSAAEFRTQLATEIRRNPTLRSDPYGKATRDGLQTAALRQPDSPAVDALLAAIKKAVDDYERRIAASDTGFAAGRPARARLNAWAVIYGKDGHQTSHRHPDGWLSGVYYVAAPRPGGSNAYRGFLRLGALDGKRYGFEPPWGVAPVEPVPGRLVLFPSYVPHATEATGIDGARISVAFDVVPDTPG